MRKVALIVLSIAIGTLIPLIAVEIALRFLPVAEALSAAPVNESDPVFRFEPKQDVTWSRGWDFSIQNRVRVNNAGYVNDKDYDSASGKPLFAVVGDSYVEAAMVPYPDSLHGRLAQRAGDEARIYSFGASGAPLSQYLIWAKEARKRWGAEALAVVVVGNDFDESLADLKQGPGFHHYARDAEGELALRRFDHKPVWWRRLARESALMRYLVFNLQAPERLQEFWQRLRSFGSPAPAKDYVGHTAAQADETRLEQSRKAVRAFLRDIVAFAGWRPDQVVFVVDGIRYPADGQAAHASYFMQMRDYFMGEAKSAGFETIDMDNYFFPRYRQDPVTFEFPTDGHWNALAHGLAADAVAESAVFRRWRENIVQPPRMSDETPPESYGSAH